MRVGCSLDTLVLTFYKVLQSPKKGPIVPKKGLVVRAIHE